MQYIRAQQRPCRAAKLLSRDANVAKLPDLMSQSNGDRPLPRHQSPGNFKVMIASLLP
jgi:hypothetical protein